MLVEDLFEQEEGFPQTWGPQEGLVDFVGGQPLVVGADDAAGLLGEAQCFDLSSSAFLPHLVTKKGLVVSADLPEADEQQQQQQQPQLPTPAAEDLARYLPVSKPTVSVSYTTSTSSHSLLDGADFALDLAAFDAQAPAFPSLEQDEDAGADGATRDEQRKQRNRESAARSRKRTRERMAYLENLVDHLMKKNRRLEVAVQQLSGAAAVAVAPPAPVYAPSAMLGGGDDMFRLAC